MSNLEKLLCIANIELTKQDTRYNLTIWYRKKSTIIGEHFIRFNIYFVRSIEEAAEIALQQIEETNKHL